MELFPIVLPVLLVMAFIYGLVHIYRTEMAFQAVLRMMDFDLHSYHQLEKNFGGQDMIDVIADNWEVWSFKQIWWYYMKDHPNYRMGENYGGN